MSGSRDVALSLLMSDADINAQDKDGKTALMIAILNGHQSLMELLLKRKADLNVKNEVSVKARFCCYKVSMSDSSWSTFA